MHVCPWLSACVNVYLLPACVHACVLDSMWQCMLVCVCAWAGACVNVLSWSVLCKSSCISVWVYECMQDCAWSRHVYHSNHWWFLMASCASACVCLRNTCSPEHACVSQTTTCIQQGKGHFRRTRMYTHAWLVHHQSVCVCMRNTRECDAFKPRAEAAINPKHTRHDTQDLLASAVRRGNHGIFIRTQKCKRTNWHPCIQQAAAKQQIHQPNERQTATLRAAVSYLKTSAQRRLHASGCCGDWVRWWSLLAFWMMTLRDSNCSGIRHSEKVSIREGKEKCIKHPWCGFRCEWRT